MTKACDLKKGAIVAINGSPHVLEDLTVSTPTARGGNSLYKMRFRALISRRKTDKTYKGDDEIQSMDFERREIAFSYKAGENWVFMDSEDYSEISFSGEEIAEEKLYISEDTEGLYALISDGRALGLELPPVADFVVTDTGPSIKGASATARTKPATLSTGLIVQVPEYLSTGEVVRVDTRTGKFLSRA